MYFWALVTYWCVQVKTGAVTVTEYGVFVYTCTSVLFTSETVKGIKVVRLFNVSSAYSVSSN